MAEKSITFNLFGRDVTASKAVGEFTTKASGHITKLTKGLGGLALGYFGVTSAIDFGKASVEAAMAAETANTKLNVALENTHSKLRANSDEISRAKDKAIQYGFTGAQVADALAVMTTGLGSSTKALERLQVVEDLAKYKGIGLSEAALIVTKGLEGQLRPLKALGIDLPVYAGNAQQVALANAKVAAAQQKVNTILAQYPDAAKAGAKGHAIYEAAVRAEAAAQTVANAKASSGTQIIGALTQKVSGEASKSAKTYAGQWATVGAQWDELQVMAGNVLIPVLTGVFGVIIGYKNVVVDSFSSVGRFFGQTTLNMQHTAGAAFKAIETAIGPFAGKFLAGFTRIEGGVVRFAGTLVRSVNAAFGLITQGWAYIQSFIFGHPLHAQGNVTWSNVTPPSPSGGGGGSYHVTPFASGGIAMPRPGGVNVVSRFAEAGVPEGIIPFTKENLDKLGVGGGGGRGQTLNVTVNVSGIVHGNEGSMGKAVVSAIVTAQKQGLISQRDWGFGH